MKATIDHDGCIFTERSDGAFRPAFCKYDKSRYCGNDCIAFEEDPSGIIFLHCQNPVIQFDVIDEEQGGIKPGKVNILGG